MKRIRRRVNASDIPRKRPVASTVSIDDRSSSSWEDVVDSDDDEANLQQHKQNLNAFCVNIVSFLDHFQDLVMDKISVGEIAPATVIAGLKVFERKITDVLCRLNQPHIDEVVLYKDNDISTLLDAREADADALYERIVKEFGPQYLLARDSSPNIALKSLEEIVDTSLQSPSEIVDTFIHLSSARDEIRLLTDDNDIGLGESSNSSLPAFLVGLKPKYDDLGTKWCHGCGAIKSLVPTHWSNSLHLMLHRLRVAIPPAGTFVVNDGRVTMRRTVRATGKRPRANFYYRMFRIHPDWNKDRAMSSVREYVDAELGVSEIGIKRYHRVAYVSVALRYPDGPATAVIGYLEAEPLTTDATYIYALSTDSHQTHLHRGRPVKYGVSRLWVAVGYRRHRVGTNMLDMFCDDHSLCRRDISFAVHEIQYGHAFVQHYITSATQHEDDDDMMVLIYTSSPAWYK